MRGITPPEHGNRMTFMGSMLRCDCGNPLYSKKQVIPCETAFYALDITPKHGHMLPMLIETEKTPNPATLKFLPGRKVMTSGTRDFASPEEAEASPLASAFFTLGDVTGVFFGSDFVSVTIAPGAQWSDVKADVLSILLDHFSADMPLFNAGTAAGITVPADDAVATDDPADAEIISQIKELIETRVRPAVANDGGDIVYRGFDKGKVFLRMQGACAGCPSSTATLKNGIESLLKHYVPEVTEVLSV
jgi:Fe-S cluster biogenesis protein NfuA